MFDFVNPRAAWRLAGLTATCALAITGTAACQSTDSTSDAPPGVALIIKTTTNPFFVTIEKGAQERATKLGLNLSVAAGTQDGDVDSQVAAINAAVDRGRQGHSDHAQWTRRRRTLARARKAGIFVVAMDTKPADPPTRRTSPSRRTTSRPAGSSGVGGQETERPARRHRDARPVRQPRSRVRLRQESGFLTGMGIAVADPEYKGDEAPPTGNYSQGGTYRIACHETTLGAKDEGRAGMQRCLADNPDINLVYTINEPAASGAVEALQSAGNNATVVSVDGGGVIRGDEAGPGAARRGGDGSAVPARDGHRGGIDAVAEYLESGRRPIPNQGDRHDHHRCRARHR